MSRHFKKLFAVLLTIGLIAAFAPLPVFAADTYVWYDGSISGVDAAPMTQLYTTRMVTRRVIVDCAYQTLDAGDADVAQVIPIPAGTTVMTAWARVITAETANGTFDLGYGGDVDEWADAAAADSAAGTILGGGQDWVPIYFASADTIDIVATTDTADVDLDGMKLEVVAIMLSSPDTY